MRLTRNQRFTLLTIALTGFVTAGPAMWTTWVGSKTQVELARRAERYAARDRRKQEVKTFIEACFELGLEIDKLGRKTSPGQDRDAAWMTLWTKYNVVLTGVLAEYPQVARRVRPDDEVPSTGTGGPFEFMGPVRDEEEREGLVAYQLTVKGIQHRRDCKELGLILVQASQLQDEAEAMRAGD